MSTYPDNDSPCSCCFYLFRTFTKVGKNLFIFGIIYTIKLECLPIPEIRCLTRRWVFDYCRKRAVLFVGPNPMFITGTAVKIQVNCDSRANLNFELFLFVTNLGHSDSPPGTNIKMNAPVFRFPCCIILIAGALAQPVLVAAGKRNRHHCTKCNQTNNPYQSLHIR